MYISFSICIYLSIYLSLCVYNPYTRCARTTRRRSRTLRWSQSCLRAWPIPRNISLSLYTSLYRSMAAVLVFTHVFLSGRCAPRTPHPSRTLRWSQSWPRAWPTRSSAKSLRPPPPSATPSPHQVEYLDTNSFVRSQQLTKTTTRFDQE